jgi:hypothetical protein
MRDGLNTAGKPNNYGVAVFDPARQTVVSSSAGLNDHGIEQGPDEWRKVWVDLVTTDGQIVLALGLVDG